MFHSFFHTVRFVYPFLDETMTRIFRGSWEIVCEFFVMIGKLRLQIFAECLSVVLSRLVLCVSERDFVARRSSLGTEQQQKLQLHTTKQMVKSV